MSGAPHPPPPCLADIVRSTWRAPGWGCRWYNRPDVASRLYAAAGAYLAHLERYATPLPVHPPVSMLQGKNTRGGGGGGSVLSWLAKPVPSCSFPPWSPAGARATAGMMEPVCPCRHVSGQPLWGLVRHCKPQQHGGLRARLHAGQRLFSCSSGGGSGTASEHPQPHTRRGILPGPL